MITAIVQARTSSIRLPNKVFKILCDKPLIWHVFNRLKYSKKIQNIVLATTTNANDDSLEEWACKNNIKYYRGNEENVLERYFEAAKLFSAETIVRITADDPFKDPDIIDSVINLYEDENLDFAYNNKPVSFPEGLDTEVFSFKALEIAVNNATSQIEKEHVTQYFYNNPHIFKQKCLSYKEDISYLRWTIDTNKDWEMAEIIYNRLYRENNIFKLNDILNLINKEPDLARINSNEIRSSMYLNKK